MLAFPSRTQLLGVLENFAAKLCLLDFSGPFSEAARALEDVQSLAPAVRVIALLPNNDPDTILRCVRQGAADFLIQPFTPDQADAVLDKVLQLAGVASAGESGGKLIAVIPAKGAAGSTTIACNLAFQCKKLGASRILLADMDPLAGTVSFLLRLTTTYSFMDVLGRVQGLDEDLWKQMTLSANGVAVLLAPETPPDPQQDLPSAAPILNFARRTHDAVILDCGGCHGAWNLSIAKASDEVLLVSTNELSSLVALQRSAAYLRHNDVDPARLKFVVNRYTESHGLKASALPSVLGCEPFQIVSAAPDAIQKSLMEGKALPPSSMIGKQLASLAERIASFKPASTSAGKERRPGLRGLFGRP
jgi:pilus assembly protein CpaE